MSDPSAHAEALTRRRFLGRSTATGFTFVLGSGLLAACGSSNESASQSGGGGGGDGEKKLSGITAYHRAVASGVVFAQMADGAKAAAQALGLEHKTYDYDANNDRELAQMDQMGTQGVKAMSTLILDNGISRQLADAAVRNDFYFMTWAQVGQWLVPCEPEIDYHYQCVANPPDGAYLTCRNMFKELNGKGTFAHITGAAGSATSLAKDKAVDRALKENPGIEFVGRERGDYNREKTRTVLANILAKTGGKLDGVFCQSDDSAVGALDALREANLLGKTLVGGADGIPEFIDAIIEGTAFGTEGAVPFFGAGYGLIMALDAAAGHKPDPAETLMVQDLVMVDNKKSAEAYKELVLGQGTKIFDYTKMSRILHPDDWDPQWPLRTFDPHQFWAVNQEVPKPNGYELPENYVKATENGGREKMDQKYADALKSFVLTEVAEASRGGKTAFGQLDEI